MPPRIHLADTSVLATMLPIMAAIPIIWLVPVPLSVAVVSVVVLDAESRLGAHTGIADQHGRLAIDVVKIRGCQ